MANSEIETLKVDLASAYEGSKWHSFKSAIKGLKPEEALWKPDHYKGFRWMDGSIQNIIFHLGGDSHYQLNHALGDQTLSWDQLTQNYNEAGGDLEAAILQAQSGYQNLQSSLDSLIDDDLQNLYGKPEGGGERSLRDFFRMMIEHHHYHAGQIVYVRSMWKGLHDISR